MKAIGVFGDVELIDLEAQAEQAGYRITVAGPALPQARPAGLDRIVVSPDQLGVRGQPRAAWLDEVDEIFVAWPHGGTFASTPSGRARRIKRAMDVTLAAGALIVLLLAAWFLV